MRTLTWNDCLFSLKTFAASMLALYIALAADLPRPYWSMAAVYIVAHPLDGSTRSKGIYRMLGTFVGGVGAVVLVPIFIDAPILLSLAISLWTGTLLYISMLDRTSRSYVFMLAGYTLPLIALTTVDAPTTIFDTAVARVEEITLGILCASVVGSIVFPTSISSFVSGRLGGWLADARHWARDIVSGSAVSPDVPLDRQKLVGDLSALDLFLSQLGHDSGTVDVAPQVRLLRSRLLLFLPVLSSLSDRLHALKAESPQEGTQIDGLLGEFETWLSKEGVSGSEQLKIRIIAFRQTGESPTWSGLLLNNVLSRLEEIVDLVIDCEALRRQIETGEPDRHWRPVSRFRISSRLSRHYDYGLLVYQALVVASGTFVASLIWIFSGWSSGSGFVIIAAVAGSFFAATDRPGPLIQQMAMVFGLSTLAAGVYLLGILPAVHTFEALALVFAPPFLLLGVLTPQPKFFLFALLMVVNTASTVALQDRFAVDFESFANGGLASVLGAVFAMVWTTALRPYGEELAAARLARAGWRDLAHAGERAGFHDAELLAGKLLDRLGQLVPRLGKMEDHELRKLDGIKEVRIGMNLVEIEREFAKRHGRPETGAILAAMAGFYRDRLKFGLAALPPQSLIASIDDEVAKLVRPALPDNDAYLNALIGLRRALFPDAPPPGWATPGPPRQADRRPSQDRVTGLAAALAGGIPDARRSS